MRKITWVPALLALLCALAACGKSEAPAAPETYTLGEDSAPALTLGEESPKLTAWPEEEDAEAAESLAYAYGELAAAGTAAGDYAALLTGEEGFTPVEEDGAETDLPDFTQSAGSVRLARPSAEEGSLFLLTLEWSEEGCAVTAERRPGEIAARPAETMTLREASEYLKGHVPEELGLPEGDMEDYEVLPEAGAVMVNGEACLELSVYRRGKPSGSNQIVGVFFLTGDRAHLYRLDLASRTVEELPRRR